MQDVHPRHLSQTATALTFFTPYVPFRDQPNIDDRHETEHALARIDIRDVF
jgi:hypothetical protein